MITIFCYLNPADNWRFLKNKGYDSNFPKASSTLQKKTQFFRQSYLGEIFLNHNIGPCRSCCKKPFSDDDASVSGCNERFKCCKGPIRWSSVTAEKLGLGRTQARARSSGSGLYKVSQHSKPDRVWVWGKVRGPYVFIVHAKPNCTNKYPTLKRPSLEYIAWARPDFIRPDPVLPMKNVSHKFSDKILSENNSTKLIWLWLWKCLKPH
jgi:hypothetical protein